MQAEGQSYTDNYLTDSFYDEPADNNPTPAIDEEVAGEGSQETYTLVESGHVVADLEYTADDNNAARVPEPAAVILLGLGLLVLGIYSRKRVLN